MLFIKSFIIRRLILGLFSFNFVARPENKEVSIILDCFLGLGHRHSQYRQLILCENMHF